MRRAVITLFPKCQFASFGSRSAFQKGRKKEPRTSNRRVVTNYEKIMFL